MLAGFNFPIRFIFIPLAATVVNVAPAEIPPYINPSAAPLTAPFNAAFLAPFQFPVEMRWFTALAPAPITALAAPPVAAVVTAPIPIANIPTPTLINFPLEIRHIIGKCSRINLYPFSCKHIYHHGFSKSPWTTHADILLFCTDNFPFLHLSLTFLLIII